MSCCPPGAWGACSPPEGYQNKGKVERLGPNLTAYIARPSSGAKSNKCLLAFTDIYGNNSGRVKAICDDYAEHLDCPVILVDYLENDEWREEWGAPNQPFHNLLWFFPYLWRHNNIKTLQLYTTDIKPFLDKEGIKSFGLFGFCAGSVHSATLSTLPEAKAHVAFHPSYRLFSLSRGQTMEKTLSVVQCPQLYCVGANDDVTPESECVSVIREKAKQEITVTVYSKQRHGWVNRGDLTKSEVAEGVEQALMEAETFFKKYLMQ